MPSTKSPHRRKLTLVVAASTVTATAWASTVFQRTDVDDALTGAAFVVAGNVADNPRPELVVSAFGEFISGPFGSIPPAAGTVNLYKNAQPGNPPHGQITSWNKTVIVSEADAITLPNRPTLAHIAGGGRPDIILPGGYFFDTFIGNARGSLTWWENSANAQTWIRHDLVTNSPFAYHSAVYEDFDGDGIEDIVTVGEQAGNPSDPADDVIELQLLRGLGQGQFAAPVKIADGGGSLIVAYDVDGDGRMDVVSPQFFGAVTVQPFVPVFARDASVASFVWFENLGNGAFVRHAIGVDQGPGFSIVPVDNLLGDGVTRWVATNHTNSNVAFPPFSLYPEPTVYEFTPGADPRDLWAVRQLSAPGDFPVTGGIGQAAPGAADAGDLDDDGRLDIAVAGDGSRAVYWMRQLPGGTFVTEQLPDTAAYGQNGGPQILDLNRSGTNEVVFGSYDQSAVSIWSH